MTRHPLWGVPEDPTPKTPRAGTSRIVAASRIELDLESPEAVAEFLEHVAMVIRERRRIVISIE